MNDESFVSGGITNSNPTLVVQLFDENESILLWCWT